MDTACTGQEYAADIASLFAALDAPALRIIPDGKDLVPANDVEALVPGLIRYEELRSRDRVLHGRPHHGQVEPGFKAEVIPGVSVRIFGTDYNGPFDLTFKVGDSAVYDGYNLIYTAEIQKIGPKTITVGRCRLDICTFAQKNHRYSAAKVFKRNSEWSD